MADRAAGRTRAVGGDPAADVLDPRGLDAARRGRSRAGGGIPAPGGRCDHARHSPAVEVRDLFERFIPREEAGQAAGRRRRPAGRSWRFAAMPRAAARIFADNPAAQCKTCHKVGDIGQSVGPDLTKIGAKYDRAAMLDQILEPSRTIEPQYVSYLVETKDGRVLTGLVVEKNGARGRAQGRAREDGAHPRRRGRAARAAGAIAHARTAAPRPDGAAGGGLAGIPDDVTIEIGRASSRIRLARLDGAEAVGIATIREA